MTIIQQTVTFGELKKGDTFKTSHSQSEVFMKIEDCHKENDNRVINVVGLSDGKIYHLDNEAVLIPVDCRVIYR